MGYVTQTMLIWGLFVIPRLTLDIASLCTKFDDSSFSRSMDMIGVSKIKNGSRDPTKTI